MEDDGPVVGSKVSTVVPNLPAGEVASDEGFGEGHTHTHAGVGGDNRAMEPWEPEWQQLPHSFFWICCAVLR